MGFRIASGSWDAIDTSIDQLYQSAQTTYLKGQWYQAEAVLLRLLRREPGDAEALLMLATLKRHTKQYDEAREALDKLERLDASRRWWFEIHREKQLLKEREEAETEAQATSSKTKADNLGEQNAERGGPSLPEAA
ncbi:tetratricopeptide repeat protein [Bremerella cremea]|uniref:tetratricopeptide repeat protein n=1 Tax=Bremerella cremea TaxID=1031537 RepID=UPI0031E5396E